MPVGPKEETVLGNSSK